jgi:lipoprotein NlpI
MPLLPAIALFLACALTNPCWAQSSDADGCFKETDPDLSLKNCTQAIDSGSLSPRNLAVAFNYRGVAYYHKGDYDHAIQDFGQAIRLNPNYAQAFNHRALSYKFKGEFDRAIQDYDQSIRLSPNSVLAIAGRGSVFFAKGDFDRSLDDLDQAIKLDPRNAEAFTGRGLVHFCLGLFLLAQSDFADTLRFDPNNILAAVWLFLSESKSPNDLNAIQNELRKNVPRPETGEWPGFVAALYLERVPSDKFISVGKSPYPGDPKLRLCDAYYYAGEHSLLGGKKTEAADFFQKALDTGGIGASEYQMARAELNRLKSPTNR